MADTVVTPKVLGACVAGALTVFGGGGYLSASKLADKIDDLKLSIVRLEGAVDAGQKTYTSQAAMIATLMNKSESMETRFAAEHERLEDAIRRVGSLEGRK